MKLTALKDQRDAAPFKPVEMNMVDGQTLKVVTGDQVFLFPGGGTECLLVLPDNGFHLADSSRVVSVGRNASHPKRRT